MTTVREFVVILYISQAFHGGSVSSATVPANLPPEAEQVVSGPPPPPPQLGWSNQYTGEQLPARNGSNQTDEEAAIAAPVRDWLFSHRPHFGITRPWRVPVTGKQQPVFGWHVTVYSTVETPYEQICGGSLVKKDTAISAAHCFWDEAGLMPPAQFAVTVGNSRRRWRDAQRYKSNVSEIIVPPRFRGARTSLQDDIAVLRLATAVDYRFRVRPACVDFDLDLERRHLNRDNLGLITGFGLTEENGEPSEVLNYQRLPYVEISDCIAASDPGFLKYITSDKICAGDQKTGVALCRGDSGGGLVFFSGNIATADMYLRGVASAAPRNNNKCNAYAIATFTHIRTHRTFLRDHIPGLEAECEAFNPNAKDEPIEFLWGGLIAEGSKMDPEDVKEPGNTEDAVTTENQLVNIGPEANKTMPLLTSVGQSGPFLNQPNDTPGGHGLAATDGPSNVDIQQKPNDSSVINDNPLTGPVKPSVLNLNGANLDPNVGFLSDVKVKGSPNTNIIFFTGPVVDPSKVYSQTNATPVFLGGRAEQPTNIYVFIVN